VKTLFGCCVFALVLLCSQQGASGSAVVTLSEVGSDVVASGSGTLNLAALSFVTSGAASPFIAADAPSILVGETSFDAGYTGLSGPNSFGLGVRINATSGIIDLFGLVRQNGTLLLSVPVGYTSGSSLFGRATWVGSSFTSLGVIPDTYVWTWGTGATADSFTLRVGQTETPPIPEPGTFGLFALTGLGLMVGRRRVRGWSVPRH
jgi:hypothetical protein